MSKSRPTHNRNRSDSCHPRSCFRHSAGLRDPWRRRRATRQSSPPRTRDAWRDLCAAKRRSADLLGLGLRGQSHANVGATTGPEGHRKRQRHQQRNNMSAITTPTTTHRDATRCRYPRVRGPERSGGSTRLGVPAARNAVSTAGRHSTSFTGAAPNRALPARPYE